MLFVCLILVSPHNCQLTSPFPKRSLLVSQQHSLCLSSESSGLSVCQFAGRSFPGCARVIQINRRASDICLPVSSCSEHTCVPACRLVFMHVRRSTAQTLRSFSTHFSVGSGSSVQHFFPFSSLAMKCQPSQNNKPIALLICHTAALRLPSGLECSLSSPPVLECGYAKYVSQCCALTCGRKPLRRMSVC